MTENYHLRDAIKIFVDIFRDGTRLFPGIPGNQKSPGILEKVKIFWNSGKTKTVV